MIEIRIEVNLDVENADGPDRVVARLKAFLEREAHNPLGSIIRVQAIRIVSQLYR